MLWISRRETSFSQLHDESPAISKVVSHDLVWSCDPVGTDPGFSMSHDVANALIPDDAKCASVKPKTKTIYSANPL